MEWTCSGEQASFCPLPLIFFGLILLLNLLDCMDQFIRGRICAALRERREIETQLDQFQGRQRFVFMVVDKSLARKW
jgi:hypothetical protein